MEDEPRIEIEAITYSPVASKRPDSDFWVECIQGKDLDEVVRRRFTNYVLRCYRAEEVDFQEVAFNTEAGTYLQDKLQQLLETPLEGSERCDITQELAAQLSGLMATSGGNTVAGAIFLIQAKINGKRHLVLVKLDLGRQEVIALRAGQERHLFCKVFEGALPESAKRFRKAILLPSPGKGDARSGQFDATSDYWQDLVGAAPLRESAKATAAILRTAKVVTRQEAKALTEGMTSKLLARVGRMTARSPHTVAAAIREETGIQKKVEKIEEELLRNLRRCSLNGIAPISARVYRFRDGMSLKVPSKLFTDGLISVKREGVDIVIRIHNSEVDRDDVVEHQP